MLYNCFSFSQLSTFLINPFREDICSEGIPFKFIYLSQRMRGNQTSDDVSSRWTVCSSVLFASYSFLYNASTASNISTVPYCCQCSSPSAIVTSFQFSCSQPVKISHHQRNSVLWLNRLCLSMCRRKGIKRVPVIGKIKLSHVILEVKNRRVQRLTSVKQPTTEEYAAGNNK